MADVTLHREYYFIFYVPAPLITITSYPEGAPPTHKPLTACMALFTVSRKDKTRHDDVGNMAIHNGLL